MRSSKTNFNHYKSIASSVNNACRRLVRRQSLLTGRPTTDPPNFQVKRVGTKNAAIKAFGVLEPSWQRDLNNQKLRASSSNGM